MASGAFSIGRLPRASGPLSITQRAPSSSTTTPNGLRRPQAKASSVPAGSAGWKRSTAPLHGTAPGTTAPGSSATPNAWYGLVRATSLGLSAVSTLGLSKGLPAMETSSQGTSWNSGKSGSQPKAALSDPTTMLLV